MDKETESRQFIYEIKKGKAIITGFQGTSARIRLPGQIEGCPVAAVERKAFLSCKSLYAVSFPDSIEEVGDWAFAHCDNLKELSFPRRAVRFGRAVFKNCGKLERIQIREGWETRAPDGSDALGEHPGAPGNLQRGSSGAAGDLQRGPSGIPGDAAEQPFAVPELLAAAVTMLDSYYLLDLERAGSREWLEQWDTKLLSILHTPDQEGYISQSVYGEEDYIGTDLEEYTSKRRRQKARLAYLRLLHPQALRPATESAGYAVQELRMLYPQALRPATESTGYAVQELRAPYPQALPPALKEELEAYLRSHTKGQPGEEAWLVLKEEHSSHREYYELFVNLRCITEDNCDAILEDIGEDAPEMKAFFLKHREEQREGTADFFESLAL